jgi:hypothetical protein
MDEVAYNLGEIRGILSGMALELKGIKESQKCQSKDCETCRGEIDGEIGDISQDLENIKKKHVGEAAITGYLNNTLVQIGIIAGAASGVISLALFLKGMI